MAIEFLCPHCRQRLSRDESLAGRQEVCPYCARAYTIPAPALFCPQCGQRNALDAPACSACGAALAAPVQPRAVPGDSTLGGLVPYKNPMALWSYYLGVFALIPCLNFPLGIAAITTGIFGLRFAGAHPEAKGKAHAWAGIILGSLWFVALIAWFVLRGAQLLD